jgi:S1-C subfamily serine protease
MAIGGEQVLTAADLVAAVRAADPGDPVEVLVRRGAEVVTVTVRLDTKPPDRGVDTAALGPGDVTSPTAR